MSVVVVTGLSGLIGSEGPHFIFVRLSGSGIDNNMRQYFLARKAPPFNQERLKKIGKDKYIHYNLDIRDFAD